MDREQRHRLRARGLFGRLADRQLGVDDLVQVAHEVADTGEREVALEAPRQLEHLAKVEQSARAAVALRAQLGPAQVPAFLEQAVEYVRDCQRVAQPADAVGELDQARRLLRDLRFHLRESFAHRLVEAVAQPHSRSLESS